MQQSIGEAAVREILSGQWRSIRRDRDIEDFISSCPVTFTANPFHELPPGERYNSEPAQLAIALQIAEMLSAWTTTPGDLHTTRAITEGVLVSLDAMAAWHANPLSGPDMTFFGGLEPPVLAASYEYTLAGGKRSLRALIVWSTIISLVVHAPTKFMSYQAQIILQGLLEGGVFVPLPFMPLPLEWAPLHDLWGPAVATAAGAAALSRELPSDCTTAQFYRKQVVAVARGEGWHGWDEGLDGWLAMSRVARTEPEPKPTRPSEPYAAMWASACELYAATRHGDAADGAAYTGALVQMLGIRSTSSITAFRLFQLGHFQALAVHALAVLHSKCINPSDGWCPNIHTLTLITKNVIPKACRINVARSPIATRVRRETLIIDYVRYTLQHMQKTASVKTWTLYHTQLMHMSTYSRVMHILMRYPVQFYKLPAAPELLVKVFKAIEEYPVSAPLVMSWSLWENLLLTAASRRFVQSTLNSASIDYFGRLLRMTDHESRPRDITSPTDRMIFVQRPWGTITDGLNQWKRPPQIDERPRLSPLVYNTARLSPIARPSLLLPSNEIFLPRRITPANRVDCMKAFVACLRPEGTAAWEWMGILPFTFLPHNIGGTQESLMALETDWNVLYEGDTHASLDGIWQSTRQRHARRQVADTFHRIIDGTPAAAIPRKGHTAVSTKRAIATLSHVTGAPKPVKRGRTAATASAFMLTASVFMPPVEEAAQVAVPPPPIGRQVLNRMCAVLDRDLCTHILSFLSWHDFTVPYDFRTAPWDVLERLHVSPRTHPRDTSIPFITSAAFTQMYATGSILQLYATDVRADWDPQTVILVDAECDAVRWSGIIKDDDEILELVAPLRHTISWKTFPLRPGQTVPVVTRQRMVATGDTQTCVCVRALAIRQPWTPGVQIARSLNEATQILHPHPVVTHIELARDWLITRAGRRRSQGRLLAPDDAMDGLI
jgi:hypothetical protein